MGCDGMPWMPWTPQSSNVGSVGGWVMMGQNDRLISIIDPRWIFKIESHENHMKII